jgi:hypothetical protein
MRQPSTEFAAMARAPKSLSFYLKHDIPTRILSRRSDRRGLLPANEACLAQSLPIALLGPITRCRKKTLRGVGASRPRLEQDLKSDGLSPRFPGPSIWSRLETDARSDHMDHRSQNFDPMIWTPRRTLCFRPDGAATALMRPFCAKILIECFGAHAWSYASINCRRSDTN